MSSRERKYWLMKSEPSCYSIDTLQKEGVGIWDGVRNYQARNMLRDEIKKGDIVLFYHSNEPPIGIVGEMTVVREGYPDPTQFDMHADHFDPHATVAHPRWYAVDVQFRKKYKHILTLSEIKSDPVLSTMVVAQKGSRLSVQPVSPLHYEHIQRYIASTNKYETVQ